VFFNAPVLVACDKHRGYLNLGFCDDDVARHPLFLLWLWTDWPGGSQNETRGLTFYLGFQAFGLRDDFLILVLILVLVFILVHVLVLGLGLRALLVFARMLDNAFHVFPVHVLRHLIQALDFFVRVGGGVFLLGLTDRTPLVLVFFTKGSRTAWREFASSKA
jgi:hypothetical protein